MAKGRAITPLRGHGTLPPNMLRFCVVARTHLADRRDNFLLVSQGQVRLARAYGALQSRVA